MLQVQLQGIAIRTSVSVIEVSRNENVMPFVDSEGFRSTGVPSCHKGCEIGGREGYWAGVTATYVEQAHSALVAEGRHSGVRVEQRRVVLDLQTVHSLVQLSAGHRCRVFEALLQP